MKKRAFSFLTAICLLLNLVCMGSVAVYAADVASGTCGDDLTWTLSDDGVLTISGTGKMPGYYYGEQPWFSQTASIQSAVLVYWSLNPTAYRL